MARSPDKDQRRRAVKAVGHVSAEHDGNAMQRDKQVRSDVRQHTDFNGLRRKIWTKRGDGQVHCKMRFTPMGRSKYEIEVQNRECGNSPGEPTKGPQDAVVDQVCQPILKLGCRFEAVSKHECHAQSGNEMSEKRNRSGSAKRPQDVASTTSRKPRLSHSRRN